MEQRSVRHNDVAELNEGFRMLSGGDTKKGYIKAQDLVNVMQSAGHHVTEDEMQDVVKTLDQQNTGNVTFSEFLLVMLHELDQGVLEEMKTAFRHYDKESTGFVSRTQFCEMFASNGERSSPEEVEELMLFAEPDGSGRIDYSKFLNNLANKLNR